jgi:hypothetical protein
MPPDNTSTVAAGTAVEFPSDGHTNNTSITRISSSTFNLENIGFYEINFNVSVTEAGQLIVVLNSVEILESVVGRATGTSEIIGTCLILTNTMNSILSINNPTGNSPALTITPVAGGTRAVSAHLLIKEYV